MDLQTFAQLAIVGTVVSLLVSFIRALAKGNGGLARVLVVVVSLIGGAVYYFFKDTSYWQSFLSVLGLANAAYTILVQFLDKPIDKMINPK